MLFNIHILNVHLSYKNNINLNQDNLEEPAKICSIINYFICDERTPNSILYFEIRENILEKEILQEINQTKN